MRKGETMSPEQRAKISAARKGAKFTAEHRAALSRAQLGNKNALGHTMRHTEETKLAIAMKKRGPDYDPLMCSTHKRRCSRAYEEAWGPVPEERPGRACSIHHRDGDRKNNSPGNLLPLTMSEHTVLENARRRGDVMTVVRVDAIGLERRAGHGQLSS